MKRILLVGQRLDVDSAAVQYAGSMAKKEGAEIMCLFLIPSSTTTSDWIDTQERLAKKGMEKAKKAGVMLKQHFEDEGVSSSSRMIRFEPEVFIKEMCGLMPADLIIANKLQFPQELGHQGIESISDLGAFLKCPVIDAGAMHKSFTPVSRRVWSRFMLYGIGSGLIYSVFFPHIKWLNKFYMTGGILCGLAIMVTVAVHAWIYGNATECLPKFIKMDKG